MPAEIREPGDDDLRDQIDITRLLSEDEEAARAAFERLWNRTSLSVIKMLNVKCKLVDPDACSEIVQTVAAEIWAGRRGMRNLGPKAWRAYVNRRAVWRLVDFKRESAKFTEISSSDCDKLQYEFNPDILQIMFDSTVWQQMDGLWLGNGRILHKDLTRQTLAGQLYYLDDRPWSEILDLLNLSVRSQTVTRTMLDDWLVDPITLRSVAYSVLYIPNSDLASTVLGVDLSHLQLDALLAGREASIQSPYGWSPEEAIAIVWHYHRTLTIPEITVKTDVGKSPEELAALFDRCRSFLPFKRISNTLFARMTEVAGEAASRTFKEHGLWKRLVIQYRLAEHLSHGEIVDRVKDAAEVAGYDFSEETLNRWISRGDIYKALLKFRPEETHA